MSKNLSHKECLSVARKENPSLNEGRIRQIAAQKFFEQFGTDKN